MQPIDVSNPKPGLYRGLDFATYARIEAANSSTLTKFARSAAHARAYILEGTADTDAMRMGRAVHTAVLEPDLFEAQFIAGIPGDGRTKKVREARAALKADNPDAEVLTVAEFTSCKRTQAAVWEHWTAKELLSGRGFNECSVVAELQGVLCKGRLDRLTDCGSYSCIVDIKTTVDASQRAFGRACANYNYATQAAFYLDITRAVADVPRRFIHIACEKESPFAVAVYELDQLAIEQGRNDFQRYLEAYKQAKATGEWPGYPGGVTPLEMPPWAIKTGEWVEVTE